MTYPSITEINRALFRSVAFKLIYNSNSYDLELKDDNGLLLDIKGYLVNFEINAEIKNDTPFVIINVDGKKGIQVVEPNNKNIYNLFFPCVRAEKTRNVCIKYPGDSRNSNDYRLVRLLEGNIVEMWRLAIVGQDEKFFFLPTKQYQGELQMDKSSRLHVLGYPKLGPDKWPQLQEVLGILKPSLIGALEHQDNEPNYDAFNPVPQPLGLGRVIFYDPAMCYGAVEVLGSVDGETVRICNARVHISQIISDEGYPKLLQPGQMVMIADVSKSPINTRQFETVFKFEALGVRAIKVI